MPEYNVPAVYRSLQKDRVVRVFAKYGLPGKLFQTQNSALVADAVRTPRFFYNRFVEIQYLLRSQIVHITCALVLQSPSGSG